MLNKTTILVIFILFSIGCVNLSETTAENVEQSVTPTAVQSTVKDTLVHDFKYDDALYNSALKQIEPELWEELFSVPFKMDLNANDHINEFTISLGQVYYHLNNHVLGGYPRTNEELIQKVISAYDGRALISSGVYLHPHPRKYFEEIEKTNSFRVRGDFFDPRDRYWMAICHIKNAELIASRGCTQVPCTGQPILDITLNYGAGKRVMLSEIESMNIRGILDVAESKVVNIRHCEILNVQTH